MSEALKPATRSESPDFFDIFRKTVLVGGGALTNMAIGLVRNKFIAVLLGPAGIALAGIFTQLIEVIGAAFSGIVSSLVEDVITPLILTPAMLPSAEAAGLFCAWAVRVTSTASRRVKREVMRFMVFRGFSVEHLKKVP